MEGTTLIDDSYPKKIDSRYLWVSYDLISSSSTNYGTDFDYLNDNKADEPNNWESSRLPDYPIIIVLKLHTIVDLDFILVSAKQRKEIDELDVYVGFSESLDDFRLCG